MSSRLTGGGSEPAHAVPGQPPPALIVFAGLSGTGKSTIARRLARATGAVWLRIDTIEQAVRDAGVLRESVEDAGYRAAYGVAEDNLRLGLSVVADCVNDCMLARNAWRNIGQRAGAHLVEIETVCLDVNEHRRRVETRNSEVPSLALPDWSAVVGREYEGWDRDHIVIDTSGSDVDQCVAEILATF
jgi:predicted kinase